MVLIVDDDALVKGLIELALHDLGLTDTVGLANVSDALTFLEKGRKQPDLIICEWALREASGLKLLETCKRRVRFKNIPFIIMDGQGGPLTRKLVASDTGADAYLPKPFSPIDLRTLLEKLGILGGKPSI